MEIELVDDILNNNIVCKISCSRQAETFPEQRHTHVMKGKCYVQRNPRNLCAFYAELFLLPHHFKCNDDGLFGRKQDGTHTNTLNTNSRL